MDMRTILFALCMAFLGTRLFSQDLLIRPQGFMLVPLGEGSSDSFTLGGGGGLLLDADISRIFPNPLGLGYTLGIEGAFGGAGLSEGADGFLSLLSGGLGLSLYYYPISRLALRLDGAFGIYRAGMEDEAAGSWYYRAGAEAGFRFTPSFILSLGGGWRYYRDPFSGQAGSSGMGRSSSPPALFQGIYLGITGQFTLEIRGSGNREQGISLEIIQTDGVYPLFLSLYQENPAAEIRIRNHESAEIRDVRVSFRGGAYTSSEFPCGGLSLIGKGQSAELPLYADFSPHILNFTESGRIAGEVIIRYRLLGKERETVLPGALRVNNRNALPADGDWTALAAFVSPTSPEILEYSKYVTGIARNFLRAGLNRNMQFGMWLFEGLSAFPVVSQPENRASPARLEVQYPAQTLAYRSGTSRDTGLLYAASLEAAGIASALIPYDGGFITLISLGVTQQAAGTLFHDLDRVLVVNDEVWLPLSMAALDKGFAAAWDQAARELDLLFSRGESLDFIILQDAWAVYPPAPFPALGVRIEQPGTDKLRTGADGAIEKYIASDILPLLSKAEGLVRTEATAANYNRLGVLQVRAGRLAAAKASYERAAGMGSVAAMLNRGNMALLEGNTAEAERWFKRALELQPENPAALRGLGQITGGR